PTVDEDVGVPDRLDPLGVQEFAAALVRRSRHPVRPHVGVAAHGRTIGPLGVLARAIAALAAAVVLGVTAVGRAAFDVTALLVVAHRARSLIMITSRPAAM